MVGIITGRLKKLSEIDNIDQIFPGELQEMTINLVVSMNNLVHEFTDLLIMGFESIETEDEQEIVSEYVPKFYVIQEVDAKLKGLIEGENQI